MGIGRESVSACVHTNVNELSGRTPRGRWWCGLHYSDFLRRHTRTCACVHTRT